MLLAVGLLAAVLAASGSQIVLVPPAPDGTIAEVEVVWADGRARLNRPGYALYVGDMIDVIYRIEDQEVESMFGQALESLRQTQAEGLPELPHSYAVLLAPPKGETGHLDIQVGAAPPARLDQAGQGYLIDGYPDAPHAADSKRLGRDFAEALEAQAATLKAMGAYMALLDHPDGYRDSLVYHREGRRYELTRPGQALALDGSERDASTEDIARDFTEALAAEREILATGLPELRHSRAVLLGHADGPLGEIEFHPQGGSGGVRLTRPGGTAAIDGYPEPPRAIEPGYLERDFGPALAMLAETRKTLESYALVLTDSEGAAPHAVYRRNTGDVALAIPGDGLTMADGLGYKPDPQRVARDFNAAFAAEHAILAAGLPELAHSRVILLGHDMGPLGEVQFTPHGGASSQRLDRAGAEVFIDGYPDNPHGADATRLRQDFGQTLYSLAQALKSLRSYIVLLESPDGAASKVIYRTAGDARLLEQPGESMTLDGFDYDPDNALAGKDFGAARTSTKQILDEGLPRLPHSYVALVRHASGPLGEVALLDGLVAGVVLDQENESVIIDGYSSKTYRLDAEHYRADFGDALDAFPPAPESFYVYFDPGGTRIAKESRATLGALIEAIRRHPAADISIAGHTDTVGDARANDRLSLKRGEAIADLIRKGGMPVQAMEIAAYGKSSLAIDTPDNTPELLNRRVEITVR
jgi:hypothetical protein